MSTYYASRVCHPADCCRHVAASSVVACCIAISVSRYQHVCKNLLTSPCTAWFVPCFRFKYGQVLSLMQHAVCNVAAIHAAQSRSSSSMLHVSTCILKCVCHAVMGVACAQRCDKLNKASANVRKTVCILPSWPSREDEGEVQMATGCASRPTCAAVTMTLPLTVRKVELT